MIVIEMPEKEVCERLERIKAYNEYHRRGDRPQHMMSRPALERLLVEWGADPKRAKGVGVELPPSPFLNSLVRPPSPAVMDDEGEF